MAQEAITLNSAELDQPARKYLLSKPATRRDWINKVVQLTIGNSQKGIEGKNEKQIGAMLGISRQWVGQCLKDAIRYKLAEPDPANPKKIRVYKISQAQKQFFLFQEDTFMQDPLVKEWVDDMLVKRGGKPLKTWRINFNRLKNFCNTFKIQPSQLCVDKKTYKEIMDNAQNQWNKGEIPYECEHSRGENSFHNMKMATRVFVQHHGISLPRNIGGVLSGKVINHGLYSDIRLTLDEIENAEKYIEEKFGLDSDVMRIFSIGVCSGARAKALFSIPLQWSEIQNPVKPEMIDTLKLSKTVFVMKAYETKTESSWTKYVIRPRAQQSLVLHRDKNQFSLIVSDFYKRASYRKMIGSQLKEVYRYLGKEFVHDGYFMRKPFHVLRHIAAQYWIKISKGNLTLVQKTCGWKSDLELTASYGELPPEMTVEMIGTVAA